MAVITSSIDGEQFDNWPLLLPQIAPRNAEQPDEQEVCIHPAGARSDAVSEAAGIGLIEDACHYFVLTLTIEWRW